MDCWMEIQDGKGPWASPVTGIVPLGSTLTMVVAINDQAGEYGGGPGPLGMGKGRVAGSKGGHGNMSVLCISCCRSFQAG